MTPDLDLSDAPSESPAQSAPVDTDLLDAIDESTVRRVGAVERTRPGQLSIWLFVVAALVFLMVIVGGTTRLTQSGLSMVRWEPVRGVVPPLSEADWRTEFDSYKAYPQYQKLNTTMTLGEFKVIYFWEYLHRLLGRVLGLMLALPFLWFLARRAIPPRYGWRLAGLVVLVGLQGAIGWWMVASGLVDRPDVAHERLALHLTTALLLLVATLWTALDLRALAAGRTRVEGRPTRWIWPFAALLTAQITMGAFVAGLDAGRIYNTWPLMHGSLFPRDLTGLTPVWSNAVDNPVGVQFIHRWLAVVVALVALAVAAQLYRANAKGYAIALELVIVVQFVLGVVTLLNSVPVMLGVAHQVNGVIVVVVTVFAAHWSSGGARKDQPMQVVGLPSPA